MSEPRTTYIGLAIIIAGLVVYGGLQIQQLTPVAHSAAVQTVPPSNNWAFPHTTLYGGGSSSGWPFTGNESDLQAPIGAPLNPTVIADYARFPMIIIPITPSGDTRPDILAALRQQNPQQKIFAYVHATGIWCPADSSNNNSYPMNGFYRQEYLDATFGDPSCASKSSGLLWMQDGTSATNNLNGAGMNMNLAHRIDLGGGNYQYDVADALATTAATYAIQSHNYDGLFLDVFCPDIQWMDPIDPNQPYVSPTNFDYVKAGYGVDKDANGKYINDQASHDAFHAGWQAGQQAYTEKLRALAIANGQPNYPISGNCAQAPTRLQPYLNGWMREGFPFQNWYAGAANFYSNMLAWPWGYLHQDQDFLSPQYNFIFTPATSDYKDSNGIPVYSPYSVTNQRKMRYGLGSASLGNGSAEFHDSSGNPAYGLWYQWWYDEYGVRTDLPQTNPAFAQAVKDSQHTTWLGMPLGSAYAQPSNTFATIPNILITNTGFETAGADPSSIPAWTSVINSQFTSNTIHRDSSSAGEGLASARIDVVTVDPTNANQTALETGSFAIANGQTYTISFKAKASASLPINVNLGSYVGQTLRADTEWREYQAVVTTVVGEPAASVEFGFALQAGTYWLDDVHVQVGALGVWRRDFEHGTVLVNPTNTAQTILLEKPFQHIRGTVNPTVNDGSITSQVTIAGTDSGGGVGDAIFLVARDQVAPAAVTNLQAP